MGGVHWTGIPKAWGGVQESNFQFGVVKSLKGKLIKNDLSMDDDSLVNMRHIQLNQSARIKYCRSQQRVFSSYLADIIIETCEIVALHTM